ncbi:MAG: Coat domain [Bacillota bacterium]
MLTADQMVEDLLQTEKNLLKEYAVAVIEAKDLALREGFKAIMQELFEEQYKIFNYMHQKGLYPTPLAEQQAITSAINKWQGKV